MSKYKDYVSVFVTLTVQVKSQDNCKCDVIKFTVQLKGRITVDVMYLHSMSKYGENIKVGVVS